MENRQRPPSHLEASVTITRLLRTMIYNICTTIVFFLCFAAKYDEFVCQFATKIEEISNYCIILLSFIIAASLSQSLQLFGFFSG